jgi:hypothetical protein
MTNAAGATEFSMSFSDRGLATQVDGDLADATRIQTILLGHTRAGDSQFGLNIRNYLMELGDAGTIQEIETEAGSLIARYAPNVSVLQLVVELISAAQDPAGRGTNSVVIGVSLGGAAGSSNVFPFAIVMTGATTGTIVSQLVF